LSVEFQVTIEGAEDFARKMRRLDEGTQEYVQQALMQTAQEVMFRARQFAPVRTGRLMQSIYAQVIYKYVVKVGCYVPYALFQEFGTRNVPPRYFLTRALQESAPKLVSIMSLALQRAAVEASVE
jgi:HK97 gp10 family phage protein